jgi:hypothetical protein
MDGLVDERDTLPPSPRLHVGLAMVACMGITACGWHLAAPKPEASPLDGVVVSPHIAEPLSQNGHPDAESGAAQDASTVAHRNRAKPKRRASPATLRWFGNGPTEEISFERSSWTTVPSARSALPTPKAVAMDPACCASSPSPSIEIPPMPMSFPWILLFGLGAVAGLILGHALGVWRTRAQLRREQARHAAPAPRLLSHEPSIAPALLQSPAPLADSDGAPGPEVPTPALAEVPLTQGDDVLPALEPSVRTFNAHALPGIAYIGKSLQPKLAFEPLHDAPVGLRVQFADDTTDLLGSLERLLRPSAAWQLDRVTSPAAAGDLDITQERRSEPTHTPANASAMANEKGHAHDAAELLQAQLVQQPHNLALVEQLGRLWLERANSESDEFERARMLDASIVQLGRLAATLIDTAVPQALLGEAGHHRVLLGPSLDLLLLEMSEKALRRAQQLGISKDHRTAAMLHELLMITVPGLDRRSTVQRLEEARALAMESLSTQDVDMPMWQEALLRNDLLLTHYACRNITARRLRYRELYAAHVEAMQRENAPGVLAAWVELLCAMAKLHTGDAAQARYGEAEETLERLREHDEGGSTHAYALAGFVLDRQHEQPSKLDLETILHAESALLPHVERHPRLRLQAAQLAMAQARLGPASRADALCRQVLSWAGPLTSSPSLMLPALRVVLVALLMSDEANSTNDRRVYSRCLEVIVAPDDAESLSLLAEVAFREQRFADGCRHCARSWRAGGVLTQSLLNAWQAGSAHWAGITPLDADFAENRSDLRMAWAGRGAARVGADNA